MKKGLSHALAALIAAALLLCCCLPAALADSFTPALDTQTECRIRVAGNYSNFESLEAEFDRFNAYYPNVELSYVRLDSYNSMLEIALAGEEAPNIYSMQTWMIGGYEDAFDAAENLADPALGLDLDCVQTGLLYRDEQGQAPMVPVFATTYGILVNEDIFASLNIAVPTTYSQFTAACEALRQAGYAYPLMGFNNDSSMCYALTYPYYCAIIQAQPGLAGRLNAMEPEAAQELRPVLEMVRDFMALGYVDLEACNALANNYEAVILRFFEGDVPMIAVGGDVVSGTKKRESISEAFSAHPFEYHFYPAPVTEEGGFFLDAVAMAFSVNKNCGDLDMTNEFMRFLVSTQELSNMAQAKRLVTVTRDMSLDGLYAAFGQVPESGIVYERNVGLLDAANIQIRRMMYQVFNGLMTVDEALAAFGTL